MERLTGIRERRVCADGEDAYSMATAAADRLPGALGIEARDLDMLVSCSISKGCADLAYVYEPPMSVAIQRAISNTQLNERRRAPPVTTERRRRRW